METQLQVVTPPPPKMKQRDLSNTTPGYKIYEYLLVLNPHEALRDKIMRVKQYFFDTIKIQQPYTGKPHITLVNFVQYQMMEERLLNRLQTIAMGCPPVKIELKDYGSFPSHTIYINITSKGTHSKPGKKYTDRGPAFNETQ
jgi:hypothetical protein